MNTGKAIQIALIHADMSRQDLADKMKCTRQRIDRLCNKDNAGTLVLGDVARSLGITLNDLLAMS
jgi:plasmid maintenance system antidote protein VapI